MPPSEEEKAEISEMTAVQKKNHEGGE